MFLDWLIDRLKEKSTWMGLTTALTAAGVAISPEMAETIMTAGVAVAGVLFVVTKEQRK